MDCSRIVKNYVEWVCKKYNLIIVHIYETKYCSDKWETIVDIMNTNEGNKFMKFKVIETIENINGDLYDTLNMIRI